VIIELLAIGFVAGIIAGISPCILPVLPVVLVAGATTPAEVDGAAAEPRSRSVLPRSLAVIAGLITSFSVFTLVGSEILSAIGLPQDFLRDAGLVILGLVGLGLLVPPLGALVERPFARIRVHQPSGSGSGFGLGLGLGAVFVPCAGPVLGAISTVGATSHIGWTKVFLTVAFSLGAAVPLLFVALAGGKLVDRVRTLRQHAVMLRALGGVVLIAMTFAIGFNLTNGLQKSVPGYTNALQNKVETSAATRKELAALNGERLGKLANCQPTATALESCGAAPTFKDVTAWLNTDGKPLTIAGLRGKVVLIDFWTYSCINCQRALPHVEAWYKSYAKDGFVVVGVHSPEFAFEHVVSNVRQATRQLGIKYPVAVDDQLGTWSAYKNEYWPAEYLIDAKGVVRHVDFGEGGYGTTESLVRQLLTTAHPGVQLPGATDLPNTAPTEQTNPETYVGYERLQYLIGANPVPGKPTAYKFPATPVLGTFGLSGTWTINSEEATAGPAARLELSYLAKDVYLVLSGTGTLRVENNGKLSKIVMVGGLPRLYTLFKSPTQSLGQLIISASPGVEAYDFTFG
jgi:cytochrome c biogenesis protein CcdA/thiol-disulfide isomerase/thioredoxin